MTEETIQNLNTVLKENICTLKKASYDTSNGCAMCSSNLKVVNFDKIPNIYSKGKGWRSVPHSNDAIYISDDYNWYFVEFKNGSIDKADIYRKIYDSIIMLIELNIIPDLEFFRNHVNYILVYNADKQLKLQKSESRDNIYLSVLAKARMEDILFGIDKFQGYLFKDVHTFTKEIFLEKFVLPMEKRENIAG